MLDEISTGLDSSTTYQITKILGNFAHMRQATVLLALLQPAPEVPPCPPHPPHRLLIWRRPRGHVCMPLTRCFASAFCT